jgi:hypothetical protein
MSIYIVLQNFNNSSGREFCRNSDRFPVAGPTLGPFNELIICNSSAIFLTGNYHTGKNQSIEIGGERRDLHNIKFNKNGSIDFLGSSYDLYHLKHEYEPETFIGLDQTNRVFNTPSGQIHELRHHPEQWVRNFYYYIKRKNRECKVQHRA